MDDFRLFDDSELVIKASDGNEAAEEELVRRYKRKVSICSRKLFLLGGDDEDLNQEGMLGLLKAIRTYIPEKGASFSTYAEKCIRSKLADAISFRKYMEYLPLDEPLLEDSSDADNDPETLIIENEHYEEFVSSIRNCLSSYERSVLDIYLQGRSCSEIAGILNKPVLSVYNAIQRIRSKISAYVLTGDSSV